MTDQNDNPDALADLLELGGQRAASANKTPRPTRPPPVCAGLSVGLPVSGLLLTFVLVSARGGTGDFACFAPAISAGLAAFPLGLVGVTLAAVALARRERWIGVAVIGIVLNAVLVVLSAPLIWMAVQR